MWVHYAPTIHKTSLQEKTYRIVWMFVKSKTFQSFETSTAISARTVTKYNKILELEICQMTI